MSLQTAQFGVRPLHRSHANFPRQSRRLNPDHFGVRPLHRTLANFPREPRYLKIHHIGVRPLHRTLANLPRDLPHSRATTQCNFSTPPQTTHKITTKSLHMAHISTTTSRPETSYAKGPLHRHKFGHIRQNEAPRLRTANYWISLPRNGGTCPPKSWR